MIWRRVLVDISIAAALLVAGFVFFSPFEQQTALRLRLLRPLLFLGVTALFSWKLGRRWALGFVFGWLTLAISFHGWWTWRHGINFFKPEPRDRYYQLRGWTPRGDDHKN